MKLNEITLSGRQIKRLMENFPIKGNGPWEILDELICNQRKLYEGLIMSYSSSSLKQKIEKDIIDSIVNIEKPNGSEKLIIFLKEESADTSIDVLNKVLQVYGWKITYPKNTDTPIYQEINGELYCKYLVDAIYDMDTSESIHNTYGNNKPTKLYHVTPKVNLNKIMTTGLTPKSNSKIEYHPERVYFITDISDKNKLKNLISQLFIKNRKEDKYKMTYIVLEIDLNKMPDNLRIKFLNDPNMNGAVYTMENIHPLAITPIEAAEIIFKDSYNFIIDLKPI